MAKSTATTTTMTTSTTASTTLECGYVTTFTDVTEQMLAEKKIRAANLAKSQFLANMSHEMRTPLNAILGCIQLLQETPILDVQLEYINIMKSSANSLLSLLSDVLDLSKIEEGKLQLVPAPFNLLEIVEVVVDIVSSEAASKGLELSYYVPIETPLFLYGDSSRLRQVLLNLLSNAVKFTFHGKIDLRVTILEETSTDISLRISVQDTGIGIPENKQKDLFQRFFQVDTSSTRKFDGSGLGLAISKAIVDLFKGKIVVESTPDHGSLFYIECTFEKDLQHKSNADGAIASPARKRLQHEQTTMQAQQPHSNNAIEISPSHSPLLSSHHRRSSSSEIEFTQLSPALRNAWTNIKIFLVDPNTSIQSLVQSYAKSWGCTCVVASDLQSGLELLERDPSFNAFFISLPNTDQRRTMVSRIKSLSPLLSSSSSSNSSNHNSNSNRLIYLLFLENRDMKNSFDSSDEWRDVKAIVKPLKRSKLYSLLLNFARSLAPAPSSQPHLNDQDDNNNTSSPTSLSTPSPPASVSTRDGNILTSPAARDTTNGTTTGGSSGSGSGGGGKKAFNPANISVLVVDDNNINKKVTTQLLKNSGFQCDVASDGHEAYEKWTKNEYDIILMDLMMPICDGFEATKLIRAQENEMMMMMRGGHLRTTRAPPSIFEGTAEEADAESQLDGLLSPATTTTTSSASIQIDSNSNSNSNSNSSANNMTRRHQHPQLQLQHTCSDSTMSSSSTSSSLIMLSPPVTPRSSSSSSTPLLLPQHQRTHTPIIAMTANTLMEELDRCLRAGMDDYITKPCTKKDLVAMIRKWVVQAEEEED